MFTDSAILTAAGRALGRIDRAGERALTGLSVNEIEAMALALVILGLEAIPPGQPAPAIIVSPEKGTTHGF